MTISAIEFNILIIASIKFEVGEKTKTKQNKTMIIVINE